MGYLYSTDYGTTEIYESDRGFATKERLDRAIEEAHRLGNTLTRVRVLPKLFAELAAPVYVPTWTERAMAWIRAQF